MVHLLVQVVDVHRLLGRVARAGHRHRGGVDARRAPEEARLQNKTQHGNRFGWLPRTPHGAPPWAGPTCRQLPAVP
eukprot:scaffold3412_cov124-Isochrysis_galbana.AAC.5